ncbi:MAG TPA: vitamin K epoxide reductase family protein [Candidatus Nanoarchaeia archaeon]|nr:vitamin K epoxide reductase family protein [Candidatus Nanoarchaeia archaeon]
MIDANNTILILASIGFLIAFYIYYKKNTKQEVVCVLGQDCNKVVNSKYGTTFGVDNTVGGMLYYVFVIIGAFLVMHNIILIDGINVETLLLIAGLFASLFSLYLAYVQVKILKELCTWCLISAAITIAIFVIEVFAWVL